MASEMVGWTIPEGASDTKSVSGRQLVILSMNQPTAEIRLGDNGDWETVVDREVLKAGELYTWVGVRNLSDTSPLVVDLAAVQGDRAVPPRPVAAAAGRTVVASPDVNIAASSAAQIAPVDVTRRVVRLAAPTGNSEVLRIGGSGVTASAGVPLAPGEVQDFPTAGEIWAYNPHSGSQTVSLTEFKE